ncbi:MAG: extensin family protein [Pseudomonadota bacterium]
MSKQSVSTNAVVWSCLGLAVVTGLGTGAAHAQTGTLVYDINGKPKWVVTKPAANPARRGSTKAEPQKPAAKAVRKQKPKRPDFFAKATEAGLELAAVQPLSEGLTERTQDAWANIDIHRARTVCNRVLAKLKVDASPLEPIKKGLCGDPAPILVKSIGGKRKVTFKPAAKLNCPMVAAIDKWLRTGLQPLARKHLKSRVTEISVMSDYACRNAYGRKGGRLSEHGRANALDIGGFVTESGKRTLLLSHWGPTGRDVTRYLAAEAAAKAKRAAEKAAAKAGATAAAAPAQQSSPGTPDLPSPRGTIVPGSTGTALGFAPNKLGGPPTKKSMKRAPSLFKAVDRPRMRFLKDAHRSACKIFGTVLGPEANNAHRNHFHIDLAPRKRSNYCR